MSISLLPRVAIVATVSLVALTGCSEVEDAARDTVNSAACAAAQTAVDEAKAQAGGALDKIGADPQAAEQELKAVRAAIVAASASGVSEETQAQLDRARGALDDLVGQAQQARQGTAVDQQAVDAAQQDLDEAVAGVRDVC